MALKIALVHDDLVQWGGAERVLQALSKIFPQATIYTSVFNKDNPILYEQFKDHEVITSFIQKIPLWKDFYRILLPLYPLAFEQFDFSGYDLVISQTTRFAKGIITKPGTKHICYCHTPPRFLWNFSQEIPPKPATLFLTKLRLYDQISSRRVDKFLAGSKNAQLRIRKIYRCESEVLYPFVELNEFTENGYDGGYYLVISRLNRYKRVDVAVEAFNKNGKKLKVVGVGPQLNRLRKMSSGNIEFLGSVTDSLLKQLILGCRGLIVTAEEDFGMSSLEAQAMGKGVIAYGVGGSLETVVEGLTGVFFKDQTPESLNKAVERFEKTTISPKRCWDNANNFSLDKFRERVLKLVN